MKFSLFISASFLWLLQINFCVAQQLYAEISLGGSLGWHKMHQTSEPATPYLQSFPTFTVGRALGVVYETPKHIFRLKYGKYAPAVSAGVLTSTILKKQYQGGMFEHNYRLLYERKLSVVKNKFQYCIGGGLGVNQIQYHSPSPMTGGSNGEISFYRTGVRVIHRVSPHLVVSNGFLYHSKIKNTVSMQRYTTISGFLY
ncbi:MAG: hypothetical protein IPL35_03735 [Sphingobacteriales bacterium]|nr:hypothetical protein [Sphingobacteriales bacterium]